MKSILQALTLVLLVFVQISFSQTTYKTPVPQSVINVMAQRQNRYHHYLWHNIRDGWYKFSNETKQQLTALGWACPRPSRGLDAKGNVVAITDNNSGEDFLYMHRQMIKQANDIIAKSDPTYGKIIGWQKIPAPGDPDFPVPANYTVPGRSSTTNSINTQKATSYYTTYIKPMEALLTNNTALKNMTLGQLGSRIETTIHNWMHLRWSNESTYGYRPSSSSASAIPNISTVWDDVRYDWLPDSYASHVSPLFWKLHGWINDRVDQWARANNLSVIRWTGFWTGGPMTSVANMIGASAKSVAMTGMSNNLRGSATHDSSEDSENVMDQVMQILANEDFESSFADDVQIDIPLPKAKKTKKVVVKKCTKSG